MKGGNIMDELDILKKQWQQVKIENDKLTEANDRLARRLADGQVSTIQDKLVRSHARLQYVGLLLPLLAILIYYQLQMPLWVAVLYALFGVVMSVLNILFVNYIKEEQLVTLPVADALRRAAVIKDRQTKLLMCGIVGGVVVLAVFFFFILDVDDSGATLLGAILGLGVGLAISIPKCLRERRMARKLYDSLNEN